MKRLLSSLLLLVLATGCASHPPANATNNSTLTTKPKPKATASTTYSQRTDVQQWAREMAARNGLDAAWVQDQLAQARFLPQVPKLMTPTPKTSSTARDWGDYRRRFIDPVRIKQVFVFGTSTKKCWHGQKRNLVCLQP